MNHVITTYGGGELFQLVFNGIAALFKTDGTGLLTPMIRVGLMVGSVYILLIMFFRSQINEGFKWLLWVVVATNLIFLPKTTIYIDDPLANKKFKVDNVPFALGTFASLVSQIGLNITQQFESVFTLPDYMPYNKTGTVFASTLMSQVGQFRIVDPVFKGNMERFVNQCVVYGSLIGHKYSLKDLQNTPDIWTLVSNNASPVLGFLYKQGHEGGEVITCKAGAIKLNELWALEIAKATTIYGSRVGNQTLTKASFFTHLQNGFQLMTGISESADKLLRQEMMINAIEEASNNKLSELGASSNYAATKALLQQRSAYAIAGDIAAKTLPLFKNVIEALSYALFIFIVVLALLPNGYRILLTYTGILVWTQLWAPLYAVLNLVMTLYGSAETKAQAAANGLTLLNSSAIINANADMMTLAAWFSVSIPFISYGILKQGAGAFVGLAHHLGSAMQQAASGSASEVVSGNISLGNVSMGTQAYQNTSAFQHNTNPTYASSQFKSQSISGVEQSTFADGSTSYVDQGLSKMSVEIMGTENTSISQQQSLSNAQSLVQSKSTAASSAAESSLQDSLNLLNQVGNNTSWGNDSVKSLNASNAKSLQDFKNFVNDIRQSTGLSEAQAAEAAIGAKIGTPEMFGASAHASTNFASSAARQKAIEAAKSIADQKGHSESFDQTLSAAISVSEHQNDTKSAELGHGALANYNQAKSLRREVSIAQNQVETLSHDISSGQSKNLSLSKNLTQDVLDFISKQPVNMGPSGGETGQIGYEGARRILENGGEERNAYLQRFQEENPQYAIESINSQGANDKFNKQFDSKDSEISKSARVDDLRIDFEKDMLRKADQANLNLDKVSHNTVKADANSFIRQIDKKIDQGKEEILNEKKLLSDAKSEEDKKNLTLTALKNGATSIIGDSSPSNPIPFDTTPINSPLFKK
jgi:conjugal transfer mating pair stabilization protein TraG